MVAKLRRFNREVDFLIGRLISCEVSNDQVSLKNIVLNGIWIFGIECLFTFFSPFLYNFFTERRVVLTVIRSCIWFDHQGDWTRSWSLWEIHDLLVM